MQAIKAIYDGVDFKPKQAIPVSGQYEVACQVNRVDEA
jgi:hypothetical protein